MSVFHLDRFRCLRWVGADSLPTPTSALIAQNNFLSFWFLLSRKGSLGHCASCVCNCTIDGNSSVAGTLGAAEWASRCVSPIGGRKIPRAVEWEHVVGGLSAPLLERDSGEDAETSRGSDSISKVYVR
jgi:hypothetical protein